MRGLHKEITEALEEIRDINKDNEYLKRKMRETSKLDKEIAEKIDKIGAK
jgi:Ni,Fe-hydrogenase III large subunit